MTSNAMRLTTKHSWSRLRPPLPDSTFAKMAIVGLAQSPMAPPLPVVEALTQPASSPADHDAAVLTVARWVNALVATQQQAKTQTSEAVYTKATLAFYDHVVWNFNSPFLWRIHPEEVQGMFDDCLLTSKKHAEVAVGTGLFLANLDTSNSQLSKVMLLDLNPDTLDACIERLNDKPYFAKHVQIEAHQYDALQKPADNLWQAFDTVAANFLIHCLHGGVEITNEAFGNMKLLLKPDGVFFGTTILGADLLEDGDKAGAGALETTRLYNELGVFGNTQDTFMDISRTLHEHFDDVEVWRIGYCAAWIACKPKP